MSTISEKLEELKVCLGEKKLKQLGLIPCSTCIQIMSQSSNIIFPPDLEHKPYLTPEDMATINASIIDTAFIKHLGDHANKSELSNDISVTLSDVPLAPNDISDTVADISSAATDISGAATDCPEDNIITHSISSETDLLNVLKSIIKNAHPTLSNIHNSGYIYSQPNVRLPHALCCSECGKLYTISHPPVELFPLPVYLSDSEYEMIKGVYVDIVL